MTTKSELKKISLGSFEALPPIRFIIQLSGIPIMFLPFGLMKCGMS
ncbi:hypothetical protein C1G87_0279 [Dehalococcoides mccartyi]|uniref:Uncharacterized protein n=1 Tax=Dehalococcoides mccartyi TaxID=61435 RepID=A0A328EPB4_9CHLR|nr:hypothetical protein C1G87_0279 [Dehalococcoides mccartyi]